MKAKRPSVGRELLESMRQANAWAKGEHISVVAETRTLEHRESPALRQ